MRTCPRMDPRGNIIHVIVIVRANTCDSWSVIKYLSRYKLCLWLGFVWRNCIRHRIMQKNVLKSQYTVHRNRRAKWPPQSKIQNVCLNCGCEPLESIELKLNYSLLMIPGRPVGERISLLHTRHWLFRQATPNYAYNECSGRTAAKIPPRQIKSRCRMPK